MFYTNGCCKVFRIESTLAARFKDARKNLGREIAGYPEGTFRFKNVIVCAGKGRNIVCCGHVATAL